MKILNRGFISVKPTTEFLNWKKSQAKDELIEPEIAEATVYLIEDEFWYEEEILKKYFKKIAKLEFQSCLETIDSFPEIGSIEDFLKFFSVEYGTFVYDLLKTPIGEEKIEL